MIENPKKEKPSLETLPDSVWNDPDYQKELDRQAEVDEVINRYEKGLG